MKTLIVCYSLTGNAAMAADMLHQQSGAEVLRLHPEIEPPKRGIGKMLKGGAQALRKKDPKLAPVDTVLAEYDRLVFVSPVWAGLCPPAIPALLRQQPVEGKTFFIVACSAGGNADKLFTQLSDLLPGNTLVDTLSLVNPLHNRAQTLEKLTAFCEKHQLSC